MSEYNERMKRRTIDDALRNAERILEEFPHYVQPSASNYDMVAMYHHIRQSDAALVQLRGECALREQTAESLRAALGACQGEMAQLRERLAEAIAHGDAGDWCAARKAIFNALGEGYVFYQCRFEKGPQEKGET